LGHPTFWERIAPVSRAFIAFVNALVSPGGRQWLGQLGLLLSWAKEFIPEVSRNNVKYKSQKTAIPAQKKSAIQNPNRRHPNSK
jgi:hypothetical protein